MGVSVKFVFNKAEACKIIQALLMIGQNCKRVDENHPTDRHMHYHADRQVHWYWVFSVPSMGLKLA